MTLHEAERRHRQRKATHAQRKTTTVNGDEPDMLVSDNTARAELGGLSRMSLHRYDRDPAMTKLGWPVRVMLNGRGYRSRKALEEFKANLMRRALAARGDAA
jgi:hypothetical protein